MGKVVVRKDGEPIVYGYFSDSSDQVPANTNPIQVKLDTNNESDGITHNVDGTLTIVYAGIYQILLHGTVDKTSGSTVKNYHIYFKKNDVNVANSTAHLGIKNASEEIQISNSITLRCAVGDTLKIFHHVSDASQGLGLYAHTEGGLPDVHSIVTTIQKVL